MINFVEKKYKHSFYNSSGNLDGNFNMARARTINGQNGSVLIIVMLLIIMFTGLGLMAMRHTRQELRSAGSYGDSAAAAVLVEGALSITATDLRRSPDYYQFAFSAGINAIDGSGGDVSDISNIDMWKTRYAIGLNSEVFQDLQDVSANSACLAVDPPDGCLSLLSSPLHNLDSHIDEYYGTLGSNGEPGVITTIIHDAPIVGPCPPGYSCFDDQNYGWYIFTVNATAQYGAPILDASDKFVVERGRASGRGRMTIGPIGAYGR